MKGKKSLLAFNQETLEQGRNIDSTSFVHQIIFLMQFLGLNLTLIYIQKASESRVQMIAPLSSNFALIFSTSEAGPTTFNLMPLSPTAFIGSARSSLISSLCFITLSTLVYPSLQ